MVHFKPNLIRKLCLGWTSNVLAYYYLCLCLVIQFSQSPINCQLVINIKNKGGEVFKETITSNSSEDIVEVEYQQTDGSLVTQLIDFKHEIQMLRVIVLGEEERGEEKYETFCFVTSLNGNDFISSDAMSKLRQRNPGTIREAEEDKGKDVFEMDLKLNLSKSFLISPHLNKVCDNGIAEKSQIFANEIDLKAWAQYKLPEKDITSFTSSLVKVKIDGQHKPIPCDSLLINQTYSKQSRRTGKSTLWTNLVTSCQCRVQICIPWYPCSLKYCRGKDSTNGRPITYRCGIQTCKKCIVFHFNSKHRLNCLWDTQN